MEKKHIKYFISFFALLTMGLFWDLASMKSTLISGDYLQQFYPWTEFYSENLKQFILPLWTKGVQSGFPIFAEGQTGMLYPLNLLFFFALPFKVAYNYTFLIHFVMAGTFMYIYARKVGLDGLGASVAAFIICLGSVYAGGFINVQTVKVLCYFPLILYLIERVVEEEEKRVFLFLFIGALWGIQLLAGSFQMVFYNIAFCLIYLLWRAIGEKKGIKRYIWPFSCSILVATFLAAPQVWTTYELSTFSSRSGTSAEFALWNSFSPLALTGSILPSFGSIFMRTNVVYVGIIGIFFVILSLVDIKNRPYLKPQLFMLFAGLFIVLGKYNPLYVLFIRFSGFYFFRGPAKSLYFVMFALAIIAGSGFSSFVKVSDNSLNEKAYRVFIVITGAIVASFFAAKYMLAKYGYWIKDLAMMYVKKNIYGKPFHKYDLAYYTTKVDGTLSDFQEKLSFSNVYIVLSFVLLAISAALLLVATRRKERWLRFICVVLLLGDLILMNFYFEGPRSAIRDFNFLEPKQKVLYDKISGDAELFRIFPLGSQESLPNWSYFSNNMIYGLDSIGLYSPLMNRDYYEKLERAGIVDDSMGSMPFNMAFLQEDRVLLEELNVKYIVSAVKLKEPYLKMIGEEEGVYLYEVTGYRKRVWIENDAGIVTINKYTSGYADLTVSANEPAKLIFSEKFYPGWKAYVDGNRVSIARYNDVLQSIEMPQGSHNVTFKYAPDWIKYLFPLHVVGYILVFISCILYFVKRKKKRQLSS